MLEIFENSGIESFVSRDAVHSGRVVSTPTSPFHTVGSGPKPNYEAPDLFIPKIK